MLNYCKGFLLAILLAQVGGAHAQNIDTVEVGEQGGIYTVMDNPGSNFTWTVEGTNIISGQGTHAIQVSEWLQSGRYSIKVMEKNILGCYGDTVLAYVIVEDPFKIAYPSHRVRR